MNNLTDQAKYHSLKMMGTQTQLCTNVPAITWSRSKDKI